MDDLLGRSRAEAITPCALRRVPGVRCSLHAVFQRDHNCVDAEPADGGGAVGIQQRLLTAVLAGGVVLGDVLLRAAVRVCWLLAVHACTCCAVLACRSHL